MQLNYVSIESREKKNWNVNRPNLNLRLQRRNEERRKSTWLNETVYPTKLPAKRKLVLAPWQLAINAALESLFGHEINSELASIIRGWISRWSSTRRVERREKKKKKKIQRCFFLHAFLPTTSTSNKRASTRFRETWLIHYSNHETRIAPTSGPRGQFRGLLTTAFVRFLWKKLFESI